MGFAETLFARAHRKAVQEGSPLARHDRASRRRLEADVGPPVRVISETDVSF